MLVCLSLAVTAWQVVYTCAMHPGVQMTKTGKCPKCGMMLTRKPLKNRGGIIAPHTAKEAGKPATAVPGSKEELAPTALQKAGKVNKASAGRTVVYHLYVTNTIVNYTGKSKHAFAINGSIPAPTLYFTEGDTAEIYLHNRLKTETSLHWHGLILPNYADGVPYLTTSKIPGGTTHLYKFPIVQNGTYWYHSHTKLQEQVGMYGAFIIRKKEEPEIAQYPIVLSEWTDENPHQVQRRLRTANDWYAIKKGSTQSYAEAIKAGRFKTKLTNEWKRMMAMDVSDVYYNRFLINGKVQTLLSKPKAGEKVKLRIVNGGASTYFWLKYAGGKMTVVANDGEDVQPVEVDRLIIAVAETYDVIVTIPGNMSYEFLATSEDRTKSASLWLGKGHKMHAKPLPRLQYFEGMQMMNSMMKMNGDMTDMGMNMSLQQMDMNSVMYPEITGGATEDNTMHNEDHTRHKIDSMPGSETGMNDSAKETNMHDMHEMKTDSTSEMKVDGHNHNAMDISTGNADMVTLNYSMLKAVRKTTLPAAPTRTMHFNLTGNMNRYIWMIDNKVVGEWDKILIKQGENIRIILTNNSMMRHPMHLHGHFFRVLNGQGEYAPLKNVLDIMPMETDTIEFAAAHPGDWFFHCHILYHMMAGMGNVFSYVNSPPNPELPDPAKAWRKFVQDNTMNHLMAEVGLESNGSDGEVMFSTTRYALRSEWRIGLNSHHGYESETYFGRFLGRNQWLFPYIGFDYHYNNRLNSVEKNLVGQNSNQNNRKAFVAGVQYTLPMLAVADARIDSKGKFRFQLSREDVPISKRLRFKVMGNTDREYMAGLKYILTKWFSLSTHYDSDMAFGAGVTITY